MIDPKASRAIQTQMLYKMEHYRDILRDVLHAMHGSVTATEWMEVKNRVEQELKLNPEFEVLEHLLYGRIIGTEPDAYKAINTGLSHK